LELRHLSSLVAVAEERGFTRAAEALGLTQAAVSQHINALERELNVQLFDRGGRSTALTTPGKKLYDHARQILDMVETARRDVGSEAPDVTGMLRIAASTVPARSVLPDLLARFRNQYPQVRESVAVSDTAEATRQVAAGEADVGIVGEMPRDAKLTARPVGADELVLVVGRRHPLAQRGAIDVQEIREHALIVREPGSASRHCVERTLGEAGIASGELKIAMEMNSHDAIAGAVERGLGAAFLSRATIERELTEGNLLEISLGPVRAQRSLYVITSADNPPSAACRAFLSFVEA
jgi:DNA-binding transcriptional LysR family regulator